MKILLICIILCMVALAAVKVLLHVRHYGRIFCVKYKNAQKPLVIPTYDGGNQGLHPSCLYFKNGWNGHQFWFVFTPYKNMDESLENPCVYYSDDGHDFTPVEYANPLDDTQYTAKEEYNSDPELVFNNDLNRIECWWRRVYTNDYPVIEKRNTEVIFRSFSYNGFTWSEKEMMLEYVNNTIDTRSVISPALIYENGIYYMWVSHAKDGARLIDRYEMSDGSSMELKNVEYLRHASISHLDVFKYRNRYYLIGFDVASKGFPYNLYSADKINDSFDYVGVVLIPGKKGCWDDGRLYRPSVTVVDNSIWLYYSAYQSYPANHNHVGLIKMCSLEELKKGIFTI